MGAGAGHGPAPGIAQVPTTAPSFGIIRGMTDTWRPLDAEDDSQDYEALYPEVTPWLEPSLLAWIAVVIADDAHGVFPEVEASYIRTMERALHVSLVHIPTSASAAADKLLTTFRKDEREWVLVDYVLANAPETADTALERILVESGSAWTVGERNGHRGLVKRVAEGTQDFVTHVVDDRGHAGRRLAEAFQCAYGVSPDPSRAYSLAVKAVEDAAIPVVEPKNASATLGTTIAVIRDTGLFKLPHTREHPDAQTHDVLLGMMRMLWTGQHDRHGGVVPPPPPVSQEEAETAVMVASTLVELFTSGKVVK